MSRGRWFSATPTIGVRAGGEYTGVECRGARKFLATRMEAAFSENATVFSAECLFKLAQTPGISTSQATFFLRPEFRAIVSGSRIFGAGCGVLGPRRARGGAGFPRKRPVAK